MPRFAARRWILTPLLVAAVATLAACSIKTAAVKMVANTMSETGTVFSGDDDPDLIRDAVPFALKFYESLLDSIPKHRPLLIATCTSFTQYSYAFVQTDAEVMEHEQQEGADRQRDRAVKLFMRAKGYCFRALELRFPGISASLLRDPVPALAKAKKEDVELLYWSAASWGAAMGLQPDLAIDLPVVRAMFERALALDETWQKGTLHEAMITVESLGTGLGGSTERAQAHFKRAVELQQGQSPGPYIALAMGISVPNQDRAEFERLLNQAVAVDAEKDPGSRLVTLVAQRRARTLLEHADAFIPK